MKSLQVTHGNNYINNLFCMETKYLSASTILATNTNVSFHICVFIYKNNESYKIFQLGNYHLISTHKFH